MLNGRRNIYNISIQIDSEEHIEKIVEETGIGTLPFLEGLHGPERPDGLAAVGGEQGSQFLILLGERGRDPIVQGNDPQGFPAVVHQGKDQNRTVLISEPAARLQIQAPLKIRNQQRLFHLQRHLQDGPLF